MTQEELKKCRVYYHSLSGSLQVLEELGARTHVIEEKHFRVLEGEIRRIASDFPNLLPQFSQESFAERGQRVTFYDLAAVRSYVVAALARLKVEIDNIDGAPVTQTREFSFVKDMALRKILERDYQEIQRAYVATCWKSVIIVAGSEIEAILADLLLQHESRARASSTAPKKPQITSWDLADLIKVSVELNLINQGVEKLSHSVREYRNLVHPGNEIRNKLTFDAEEAKIAVEVLHIVHRDLC
jgi:hypothetical protein